MFGRSSKPDKYRWPKRFFFVFLGMGLGFVAYVFTVLYRSTPGLGQTHSIPGLGAEVRIEQDGHGMPTITGKSLADVARGQGWVVARDRFFQMDLIRRRTAGTLSEIFGRGALDSDKRHRVYGFSRVAEQVVLRMAPPVRDWAQAYADGVNAFLKQGPLPFEVRVLRYQPAPWQVTDTVLVMLSMYESLNHATNESETSLNALTAALPPALVNFLTPEYGFLDAPLVPDGPGLLPPPVPGADVFDLRKSASRGESSETRAYVPHLDAEAFPGSNAWAIAGSRTKSGKPIVAGDPHLHVAAPNIWYRVRLNCPEMQVTGVALPGVGGVVIGSNGKVAWSFTNPQVDNTDFVDLQPGKDADHYLNEGKESAFRQRVEKIEIRGMVPEMLVVHESPWGPVVGEHQGKVRALQWSALDPDSLRELDLVALNTAHDLPSMLDALSHWVGPPQNSIFATQDGHIGWVLVGKFPRRVGFDGRLTVPRDPAHRWDGYLPFAQLPKVIDPPSGYLVSANQRPVPVDGKIFLFGNDWPSSARAFRIRELVESRKDWTAESVHQIQLDITSHTHEWYRDRLSEALASGDGGDPWLKQVSAHLKEWDGRSDARSKVYPFLRAFRLQLMTMLLKPLIAKAEAQAEKDDREEILDFVSRDAVVKQLLDKKPLHLLAPPYHSYDEVVRAAAVKAAQELGKPEQLTAKTWGEMNQSQIRHPFALVLPRFLAGFFNMPPEEMSGDHLVPRVCRPQHAASMRTVFDLQDPAHSLFSQPGGESGHVLSPYYRDLYPGWINGQPVPLEPGAPVSADILRPS